MGWWNLTWTRKKVSCMDCPCCGAGWNSYCKPDCPQRLAGTRTQNAPVCDDGLHHHCALKPHCLDGCVNAQDHSYERHAALEG